MRTKNFRNATIALIMAVIILSCNNEENKDEVEYQLIEISGRWTNFNANQMIIINNQDELEEHYIGDDYPEIDFSKYTLLVAAGGTPTQIYMVNVESLQKLSMNRYKLNIKVILTFATRPDGWCIAIITNKIGSRLVK